MTATEEILADLKIFFLNNNNPYNEGIPVLIIPSDLEEK